MDIQNIKTTVCLNSINPTLLIGVFLQYEQDSEAIVSIAGRLLTNDNKIISLFSENQIRQDERFNLHLKVKGKPKSDKVFYTELGAVLSPKAIEQIEQQREAKNGEVKFSLEFVVKYLEYSVDLENLSTENLKYLRNNPFSTLRVSRYQRDYNIPQSVWTKDYAPQLGIGNFLLVELQIPDDLKVPELWKNRYKRLSQNLKDMEKYLRIGDWQATMTHARKFYENAKIGDKKASNAKLQSEFDALLLKDQHSAQGTQDFYDGIWKFFEFLSKYIHDTDKSANLVPSPNAQKEDAYLAFSLAMGLFNFIGKKISKG